MRHNRLEQMLQRQIADFLRVGLGGSAWFTCFPAGGGGRLRGAILAGMGLKPGVPDLLIIDAGRALWIELKTPKGSVSPVQKECHSHLALARSTVAVCRSLEDVIAFLHREGVPLKVAHTGTAG